MNCKNCNQLTINAKFCSRSCSAIYNNKAYPKRKVEHKCKYCETALPATKRICSTCKSLRKDRKIIRQQSWRTNHSDYNKNYRLKKKLEAIESLGGCCCLCGYDKCPAALEFHHLDPSQKEFSFSSSSRRYTNLEEELSKCILVCANCHREVHYGAESEIRTHEG